MKHLRSWSIFESVNKSDFNIGLSEIDIKEIFMEIVDMGYDLDIQKVYLTDKGRYFSSKVGLDNFYPIVSISLKKDIKLDTEIGDLTNWDGSVYYTDVDFMDTLSLSIGRLKNMCSDKAKVLVSTRDITNINIRVVLPFKKLDDAISIDAIDDILVDLIREYTGFNDDADFTNLINLYQTDLSLSSPGYKRSFDITPIFDGPVNTEEPSTPGDFIFSRMLTDNEVDNKNHLSSIFEIIIKEFLENINKVYPGCKLKAIAGRHNNKYEISSKGDISILKIENYFETLKEGNIFLGKKSFFKKRNRVYIYVYKMVISVKYNREQNES
jgi:hypothetical protein